MIYNIPEERWFLPTPGPAHRGDAGADLDETDFEETVVEPPHRDGHHAHGLFRDTEADNGRRRAHRLVGRNHLMYNNEGAEIAMPSMGLGVDPKYILSGVSPPGRNGHTATIIPSSEVSACAKIIVVGGWLGVGPLAASDMHILDISQGGKRLRWYQPAIKGTPPGPCNMHSADYVPSKREVYLFRGGNGREYLNDLHALHVDTLTWREVETFGQRPQRRANHSAAFLEETNELFVFGGWNGDTRLNDLHILDIDTSTWSSPDLSGLLPRPRAGMTLTALRGRLFLFGGSGTNAQCFQDLHVFDRQMMSWLYVNSGDSNRDYTPAFTFGANGNESSFSSGDHRTELLSANPNDEDAAPCLKVLGTGPGYRAGHTATTVGRKIYIFGGSHGPNYLNSFYSLDTDPTPQVVVDDATSLVLVERRLHHFCNNEQFSDVVFLVEGRRIYGHKMVLSIVSEFFRTMFASSFRESQATEIEIQDASYNAFLIVLEYIYTGSLSGMDTTNIEVVVEILELADRFFLDNLKQVCERMLRGAINDETVDFMYDVARKTNALQLQTLCAHFLRN